MVMDGRIDARKSPGIVSEKIEGWIFLLVFFRQVSGDVLKFIFTQIRTRR